jgi:predicted permease
MATAFGALAPVFALVALGFILRKIGFPQPGFWPVAEKLTYFVLFPALLFESLANARIELAIAGPMAAALAGGVLVMATLALVLRPVFGLSGPGFTSLFQGAIRPNTYVGIAVALGIWGESGVALCAIGIAAVVPLVNVLCVAVLARLGAGQPPGAVPFIKAVIGNPLILACAGGGLANALGLTMPVVMSETLSLMGKGALLLGLMAVGAALELDRLKGDVTALGVISLAKLAAIPGLTALGALLLGVDGQAFGVAVMYAGLPVSASSYVLASQMGGDKALMAGAVTATTLLAVFSLPVILWLVGAGAS